MVVRRVLAAGRQILSGILRWNWSQSTMTILFFAHLRGATGCAETTLARSEMTTEQLWDDLIAEYPRLAAFRRCVRLACNGEYVGPDARFRANDEIALIPPVSGG